MVFVLRSWHRVPKALRIDCLLHASEVSPTEARDCFRVGAGQPEKPTVAFRRLEFSVPPVTSWEGTGAEIEFRPQWPMV